MSDELVTRPQPGKEPPPDRPDEDEEQERRRFPLWLLLLLLLLIPAYLCGPRLLERLRRDVVEVVTPEPVETEVVIDEGEQPSATEDAVDNAATEEPTEPASECGDGVCSADETCPEDCEDEEPDPVVTEEVCTDCVDGGPGNPPDDTPVSGGSCGATCSTADDCDNLPCLFGVCFDVEVCLGLPPLPENPPDDGACSENGGMQWQGEVCVCEGVVDQVTICQDGSKIDVLTTIPCTPGPDACPDPGNTKPECGNGIKESGEECDGDASVCGGGNWTCTAACTCQD